MALCDVNDIELSKIDLVHYNSQAERNYMGLKNGILDQSSNILNKDGHLMVMNCQTNEFDLVPKGNDFPFDFELTDFSNYFEEVGTDIITAYAEENEAQQKRAGIVELDENSKVLSFEGKPEEPKSKFAVPAFYL